MSNEITIPANLPTELQPWFRKVIAHPEGAVVHDGDCHIYKSEICDCGLLRAARRLSVDPGDWIAGFWDQLGEHDLRSDGQEKT